MEKFVQNLFQIKTLADLKDFIAEFSDVFDTFPDNIEEQSIGEYVFITFRIEDSCQITVIRDDHEVELVHYQDGNVEFSNEESQFYIRAM